MILNAISSLEEMLETIESLFHLRAFRSHSQSSLGLRKRVNQRVSSGLSKLATESTVEVASQRSEDISDMAILHQ